MRVIILSSLVAIGIAIVSYYAHKAIAGATATALTGSSVRLKSLFRSVFFLPLKY